MAFLMRALLALILVYAVAGQNPHRDPILFQQFYGGFGKDFFKQIVEESCKQEAFDYWNTANQTCPVKPQPNCKADPIVNCVLSNLDESSKSNLAVSAVLLGLLPSVLSLGGSTTNEIGLLAMRRPILATLLASASPSIFPIRALDFQNPISTLRNAYEIVPIASTIKARPWRVLVVFLEYILALGAIVNIAGVCWDITFRSPNAGGADFTFYVYTWPLLALFVHTPGVAYINHRVRLRTRHKIEGEGGYIEEKRNIKQRLHDEVTPCIAHKSVALTLKPETYWTAFLNCLTSLLTLLHILYGTTYMSASLLVPSVDALTITTRFVSSTLVSRILIMYELRGMRQTVEIDTSCKEAMHYAPLMQC